MKLSEKVIKIYNKKAKAHETLLKCDIEINDLLIELNKLIGKEYENTKKS